MGNLILIEYKLYELFLLYCNCNFIVIIKNFWLYSCVDETVKTRTCLMKIPLW